VHNEFLRGNRQIRAARRLWAGIMRDRYGAKNERSLWCRCHCQTAGVSLTEQQPMVNIIRVAYQALAAVLGGTQSLHTNSMDETLALPTEHAVRLRCARSRSLPRRPASRAPSIRSAAASSWRI